MTASVARTISGVALIVATTLAAYVPAMRAGFIWDDDDNVTESEVLRSADGLRRIWLEPGATQQYYPLVHTSFWLEYRLWHLNPLGHHVVNVVLHAANAVLVWAVLRRLRVPGAWFAAAVFALHPVHVESVAWITERKNVLSGFFYLLAVLAYLRFAGVGAAGERPARGWGGYPTAFLLFLCAVFSKTVTCSLPAAMILLLWWKHDRLSWRDIPPLLPMFLIGAALALLTGWVEANHVGAQGRDFNLYWADRVLVAGRAVWFYVGKLLWPTGLMAIYPRWAIDPRGWWEWLYPAAVLGAAAGLWFLRGRIGKAPLVSVLFFVGTLVPTLGFADLYFMRYTFVADHWQYLPSLGLISLFVAMMAAAFDRLAPALRGGGGAGHSPSGGLLAMRCSMAVILTVLGGLTWRQARVYRNSETLWRDALAKNPAAWMAHNNLAMILTDRGELEAALEHLATALRLSPHTPEAHQNMGRALLRQGKVDGAIGEFRAALDLAPEFAAAHHGLAAALVKKGRIDEAIEHYRQALRSRPALAEARNELASLLIDQGRLDEAIGHLRLAVRLKKDLADAHSNLGRALAGRGKTEEAIAEFAEAARLEPERAETHGNLALALAQSGRLDKAIQQYTEALRLRPDWAKAHYNVAVLFARQGNTDAAVAHLREVRRIQPDNAPALAQLADLLVRQKRIGEALDAYRAALRAEPGLAAAANNLAWILATHPDPAFRNGAEAVRIAEQACAGVGFSNAQCLDTLAAAYAEAGRFKDAVETARKALSLPANPPGRVDANAIAQRLTLYEAGRPYRSEP